MTYQTKEFTFPQLSGLSEKQMSVHTGLYAGYVKHVNLILEKIMALSQEKKEENQYLINELRRRFAFEFNGMRMHENYFEQLVSGATERNDDSVLSKSSAEKYGSYANMEAHMREVAGSRGIGWVTVYYDKPGGTLNTVFINDHELGQLAGLPIILAVDMWEHAFMVDYIPSEKSKYLDAFFANLNWKLVEERFAKAQ